MIWSMLSLSLPQSVPLRPLRQGVEPVNLHNRLTAHPWVLPALGIILLSAHGLVFYFVRHHLTLSATILSGVAVIVVIKHLGAFSYLYALLRKRTRKAKDLPF